jgi:hypothetical protein
MTVHIQGSNKNHRAHYFYYLELESNPALSNKKTFILYYICTDELFQTLQYFTSQSHSVISIKPHNEYTVVLSVTNKQPALSHNKYCKDWINCINSQEINNLGVSITCLHPNFIQNTVILTVTT